MKILEDALGNLFRTPKPRRKRDPGYGRLYRWCKKNGVTYKRDLSYWDFDHSAIGTISANDGGESYDTVLEIAKERLAVSRKSRSPTGPT